MREPISQKPVSVFPTPDETIAAHKSSLAPTLLTILIISVLWVSNLVNAPIGGFSFSDEFHTLDRSTAFAIHGEWHTIYSMHEPSFRKPPLQYWMSALFLEAGIEQWVALRLPSLIFALGSMISVALLAAAVMPANLWAMPTAVLLFSSSAQYWQYALSATLDSGAVFLANLALAATILALKRPGWWYVAGIAIALGSLQKAPIGLLLAGLYLGVLSAIAGWQGKQFRHIFVQRPFKIFLLLAILGTLAWPILQTILHGTKVINEFFGNQMVDRFLPANPISGKRSLSKLASLILGTESYLRLPAIAALTWLPWRLKRTDLLPLPIMFALFVTAMFLAGGYVAARYTLIFLPMLSVALAATALSFLPRNWAAAGPLIALLAFFVSGTVKGEGDINPADRAFFADQIAVMSRIGDELQPGEMLVVCAQTGERRINSALASHYAANGRPFVRLTNLHNIERFRRRGMLDGPLRGICKAEDLQFFAETFVNLRIHAEQNGYVIWTADGARESMQENPK